MRDGRNNVKVGQIYDGLPIIKSNGELSERQRERERLRWDGIDEKNEK